MRISFRKLVGVIMSFYRFVRLTVSDITEFGFVYVLALFTLVILKAHTISVIAVVASAVIYVLGLGCVFRGLYRVYRVLNIGKLLVSIRARRRGDLHPAYAMLSLALFVSAALATVLTLCLTSWMYVALAHLRHYDVEQVAKAVLSVNPSVTLLILALYAPTLTATGLISAITTN